MIDDISRSAPFVLRSLTPRARPTSVSDQDTYVLTYFKILLCNTEIDTTCENGVLFYGFNSEVFTDLTYRSKGRNIGQPVVCLTSKLPLC